MFIKEKKTEKSSAEPWLEATNSVTTYPKKM